MMMITMMMINNDDDNNDDDNNDDDNNDDDNNDSTLIVKCTGPLAGMGRRWYRESIIIMNPHQSSLHAPTSVASFIRQQTVGIAKRKEKWKWN